MDLNWLSQKPKTEAKVNIGTEVYLDAFHDSPHTLDLFAILQLGLGMPEIQSVSTIWVKLHISHV